MSKWRTLEVFGMETEYMIVNKNTLEVEPYADRLLINKAGKVVNEIDHGIISWSNELAKHVIELKLTRPLQSIEGISARFHESILKINMMLEKDNMMLLPSAMHPFFLPGRNVLLWPYGQREIYNTYDRIFNCGGHGWINVQSSHLNISFSGEEDFVKLHSVIRFILPIIPGLSASSPIFEEKYSGYKDARLTFYGKNQQKIPEISGEVIPEIISGIDEYQEKILEKMYRAIKPYDPEGNLQDEWLNSRGAIARFDRSAIEIRIIDSQESALADELVLTCIIRLIKKLFSSENDILDRIQKFPQNKLVDLYNLCIENGEDALITDNEILGIYNISERVSVRTIWIDLFHKLFSSDEISKYKEFFKSYEKNGTLASKILYSIGDITDHEEITGVYRKLADCLKNNRIFQ